MGIRVKNLPKEYKIRPLASLFCLYKEGFPVATFPTMSQALGFAWKLIRSTQTKRK